MKIDKVRRRVLSRRMGALLAGAFLVAGVEAHAQGPQPAPATPATVVAPPVEQACPPPFQVPAALLALTDKMLKPGEKFDLSGLTPEAMQQIMAVQKEMTARQAKDWPNLCHYAADNATVIASGKWPHAILMGDSITENWLRADPVLFNSDLLDRGISGQTTPQMLLRAYHDVIALHPRVVHIMAGTNDISGNTGPETDQTIIDNIRAMIILAKANGIKVVLGSITPSSGFAARPGANPSARIVRVNGLLRQLAAEQKVVFVDYHTPLTDAGGGMPQSLSNDGLHPNRDGYAIIKPLMEQAIARASGQK